MKCKDQTCHLKAHWTEINAKGEKVFCFKSRHNGKYHVQKYTFRELAEILNNAAAAKA